MAKTEFTNAFNIAIEREIEEVTNTISNESIVLSQKFEAKMNKLIKAQKSAYWKYINSTGKKIAIIAISSVILFAGSMSVEAIRTPVVNKLTEVFDRFIQYTYSYYESNNEFKTFEPNYVPAGFSEKRKNLTDASCEIEYVNSNNETIIFIQVNADGTVISNDNEFINKQNMVIDGQDVTLLITNNYVEAYWIQEQYYLNITAYFEIKIDELEQMIKSVK